MQFKKVLAILVALAIPSLSHAAITFTNVTADDFNGIVKDFSANTMFTTVSPASSLGKVWGFEIGAVAGVTKTPSIERIVRAADPAAKNVDKFPHGNIIAAITIPWAITAEFAVVPKVTASSVSYQSYGGALKWSFSEFFFEEFPVTLATRAFYTQSKITYTQPVSTGSSVNLNVDFTDKIYGGQLLVSKKLWFLEPYLGGGFAQAKADIGVVGSTTIFATSFTASKNASASQKSFHYFAGLNAQLLFFVLGAEYERAFSNNSVTGKFAFRF